MRGASIGPPMRMQLLKYWDRVRSSFWFVPAAMAACAMALSYLTVALDQSVAARHARPWAWAYTGDAQGASAILTSITSSMVNIVGVVFSLTLVALSLAASQFGPRLLRNFMRDTSNQIVLGTFVATFLYCLLVMRTIRRDASAPFVPHLSVTLGVLLACASLGVLIYFIHHVSVSIQADRIIQRVGTELIERVETLFPEQLGQGTAAPHATVPQVSAAVAFERPARTVCATADGYLQLIDAEALMSLASRADVVCEVTRRPGDYLVRGSSLLQVWPAERVADRLIEQIGTAFVLGSQRTSTQDIEHVIGQLVEVAVRALSPGVNDPFTATACIDRLASALCRLAQRRLPSPYRRDEHDVLRIVAPAITFTAMVDCAFNDIRRYGAGSVAVSVRLLQAIDVIARAARRADDIAALRRHAGLIAHAASEAAPETADRTVIEECYAATRRTLDERSL
jgi:uncharacterized membrane protein